MGQGLSDQRTFELSANQLFIHIKPDDVLVPIKSLASIKMVKYDDGTARLFLRTTDAQDAWETKVMQMDEAVNMFEGLIK